MASSLTDTLNRVQFIAEDFDTYRTEANNFFALNFPANFNNLLNTDLGNALMDQLAFAMMSLSFMVNRRASELFLATAKLNSSIVKLAKMLGYPIQPAFPGTTNLSINFTNAPYNFPIQINQGFQWQGPGNIIYEYTNVIPAVLNAGQTQLPMQVFEGTTNTITFSSNGQTNQVFQIFGVPTNQFLYAQGLIVTVDGNQWTRVPILNYQAANIFDVLFTDNPPVLEFGDGIIGNVPPLNSSIVLVFRTGFGLSGTIGANQISGPVTDLVVNGQSIPMTVTNTAGAAGGNPEDIRHVQSFASSFFRTQNAAVIKSDYDTIAELQPGVALADAQIMRGIDQDITIQGYFAELQAAETLVLDAVTGIASASVTGQAFLGVSGENFLGVSGLNLIFVGGTNSLGVSGTQYLGSDVSGNVTGIGFLGVSGVPSLFVGGQSNLGVSGMSDLGVSGINELGISDFSAVSGNAVSGFTLMNSAVSGLAAYLSQELSDTSKANQVQVIVLSVDMNNKYISPPGGVLTNVQTTLQGLADAVVTVVAVDGSSRLIPVNIDVELGISLTAVQSDVETASLQALIGTAAPYGILVRRGAGVSLFKSQIQDAIEAANNAGDIIYMNINITSPANLLDSEGNLIIGVQHIIQNNIVTVKAVQRQVSPQIFVNL